MAPRAELRFLNGDRAGQVFPLDGGRTVLGRQVGDIVLSDREVSSIHAIVSFEHGTWRVMDLGSTNGVFVDGVQATEAILDGPCEIRLGRTRMEFRPLPDDDAPVPESPAPAAETAPPRPRSLSAVRSVVVGGPVDLGLGRAGAAAPVDADTEEIPLNGAEAEGPPRPRESRYEIVLEVLEGADRGLVHRFESDAILIGRLNSDLVVRDGDVSRRHAIIEVFGDDVYLRDLNSTNGTYVNGKRVTTARLATGDRLKLGRCVLAFSVHQPSRRGGRRG